MSGTVIILYRNYIKRNEYWKLLTKNDSSDPLKKHFTIHKLETTTIRTSISQIKKKKKRIFSLHFHILFITSRSFFSFYKLQNKQRGTIISFFLFHNNRTISFSIQFLHTKIRNRIGDKIDDKNIYISNDHERNSWFRTRALLQTVFEERDEGRGVYNQRLSVTVKWQLPRLQLFCTSGMLIARYLAPTSLLGR